MAFPAFLDTCTLFGAYLCDTVLKRRLIRGWLVRVGSGWSRAKSGWSRGTLWFRRLGSGPTWSGVLAPDRLTGWPAGQLAGAA